MSLVPVAIAVGVLQLIWLGPLLVARNRRRVEEGAHAREQTEESQRARGEEIRRQGIRMLMLSMLVGFRARVGGLEERRDQALQHQRWFRELAQKVRKQIFRDGDWSVGFVVVIVVLTMAWGFLLFLLWQLDQWLFEAIGYTDLAAVYGTLIALSFTVLGVVFYGLLGLHQLFPGWLRLEKRLRLALAANVLAVAIVLTIWLQHYVPFRSEAALGNRVTTLQAQVDQDRAQGANPLDLRVAELQLARAKQRLQAGKSADQTSAVVVPLLELVVSPAPVFALELMLWLALLSVGAGQGLKAARLQRRINQLDRETAQTTVEGARQYFTVEEIEEGFRNPPVLDAGGQQVGGQQEDDTAEPGEDQSGPASSPGGPADPTDDPGTDDEGESEGGAPATPDPPPTPRHGPGGTAAPPIPDAWGLA